ncbi:MAG: hypothetical protein A2018_07285 [Alphaproteobacteria bacterium GWF2_58_20]|nr:MAG: hypothetical protein A2018_07285 [Alphaproteobacteria bacterium GWF2_58_20]
MFEGPFKIRIWHLVMVMAILVPVHLRAEDSAVVLAYHRFGEDAYPGSSIRIDQFENHLAELRDGGFHVLPLKDIVDALDSGRPLPDKAVAITIDGARRSVSEEAVPRLVRYGFPFTVFVASDPVDFALETSMSWTDIASLPKKGGSIGLYPSSLEALGFVSPDEAAARINRSSARIAEMTGGAPALLAWPAGEASLAVQARVKTLGYKVAFGMQSGSVARGMDMLMLPRFSMTEKYGDIERFRISTRALPLLVSDMVPADMVLRENPPNIGFTVDGDMDVSRLACFVSGRGKAHVEVLGGTRVEVRLDAPLEDRRTRLNCTLPAGIDEAGLPRWRWLGAQYVLPQALLP